MNTMRIRKPEKPPEDPVKINKVLFVLLIVAWIIVILYLATFYF